MAGVSAFHWVEGATASPGGLTTPLPLGIWNHKQEDEVNAYDHVIVWPVASTDEPMEMDLDGPEYYGYLDTPIKPPLPESDSLDITMLSWPWCSWPSTPCMAQFTLPPTSTTETSTGSTATSHCRRRRRRRRRCRDIGVELDTLQGLPPGGLGRVLDQKRTRTGLRPQRQRQGGGGGASSRRRRLQTIVPRESHVNKPPLRVWRKPWGYRQFALCLDWIWQLEGADGGADGGWRGSTSGLHATVGMTNIKQHEWDLTEVELANAIRRARRMRTTTREPADRTSPRRLSKLRGRPLWTPIYCSERLISRTRIFRKKL